MSSVTLFLPTRTVVARLGVDGALVTGGYGGWVEIPRPGRKSYTEWEGIAPVSMDVSFLLDGFADSDSVESDIFAIENAARVSSGAQQPPEIRLSGPVPRTELSWLITAIGWEPALRRSSDGARVRQAGTLSLMESVKADVLLVRSPAQAARTKPTSPTRAKAKFYVVKAGDTLVTIATRQLGAGKRWKEIAVLNGIRDPRSVKVGQKIALP